MDLPRTLERIPTMSWAEVVATWLHVLSTVIVLGYYGILGRIVLPGLERSLSGPKLGQAIVAIERRAVPFLGISVVAFTVTGVYLLVVDPSFDGLGRYGSTWASLMLVKHLLVGLMVVGGVGVHWLAGRVADPDLDDEQQRGSLRHLRLAAEAMTGVGAVILLLTAAAQVG